MRAWQGAGIGRPGAGQGRQTDLAQLTYDGAGRGLPAAAKFPGTIAFNVLAQAGNFVDDGSGRPTRSRSCATRAARSSASGPAGIRHLRAGPGVHRPQPSILAGSTARSWPAPALLEMPRRDRDGGAEPTAGRWSGPRSSVGSGRTDRTHWRSSSATTTCAREQH